MTWDIRSTRPEDLDGVMNIYAHARTFMAAQGNPDQWGDVWPPQWLIEQDIATGKSHVATYDGSLAAVFFYDYGDAVEPTYAEIENGAWLLDGPYGVVHRIASIRPGAGSRCLRWAMEQSGGHLRIDTHERNIPMQRLLGKLGFKHCGTIYVYEDRNPRLAFETFENIPNVE